MAKKGGAGTGLLIFLAIVVYPFVWLYETLGAFWFWVVIIGVPASIITWRIHARTEKTNSPVVVGANMFQQERDPWIEHCERIESAWKRGDYDWARHELQKIAYSMVNKSVTDDQRIRFKQVMTEFANEDLLYRDVIEKIRSIVLSQPGIIQSSIYKLLPGHDQETVRYVLYFAHELGDIHRRKKGRSYELLPPGRVLDGQVG